jgi:hypothetical protein
VLFPLGQWIGTKDQNLNWMWKPFGVEQVWLPPWLFALVSIPLAALLIFWPGDLFGRWLTRPRESDRRAPAAEPSRSS